MMQLTKVWQMITTQVSINGGKIINIENFCIFQFLNKCLILNQMDQEGSGKWKMCKWLCWLTAPISNQLIWVQKH